MQFMFIIKSDNLKYKLSNKYYTILYTYKTYPK